MKKFLCVGLVVLLIPLPTTVIFASSTANVLDGGVCINEILIDPNGTFNFDTDGNGTANDSDEFIELYNLSGSDIDISGWEFWDAGMDKWFTFPGTVDDGTTILKASAYAVVVVGVQTGGSLPIMTNPDSLVYDAASSSLLTNGGDNVVLYDPGADQYIQLLYNGDGADIPHIDYAGNGFSATATRVGSVEDFGSDAEGKSLTRYPAGDTNVVVHNAIPGVGEYASPNRIRVTSMGASGLSPVFTCVAITCMTAGLVSLKRRKL